jgi:hypothetical protein
VVLIVLGIFLSQLFCSEPEIGREGEAETDRVDSIHWLLPT